MQKLTPLRFDLRQKLLAKANTYADATSELIRATATDMLPSDVAFELAHGDRLHLEYMVSLHVWRFQLPTFPRKCQEASPLSKEHFIPCGNQANSLVYHSKDRRSYYMCPPCASHNINNRGGKVMSNSTEHFNWQINNLDEGLMWLALNNTLIRLKPVDGTLQISVSMFENDRNIFKVDYRYTSDQFIETGAVCLANAIAQLAESQWKQAKARIADEVMKALLPTPEETQIK